MALDLQWAHNYCLACDKQTDGAAYCSEACRLADFERTCVSAAGSAACSPAAALPKLPWASPALPACLPRSSSHASTATLGSSPASAQPAAYWQHAAAPAWRPRALSPSSSHSSLSSMRSSEPADAAQLSDNAKKQLRAYAGSFETVRLQRRRST